MNNGSSHAANSGSPMARKVRRGNAIVKADVLLMRHGPWTDLQVFHASRTVTPLPFSLPSAPRKPGHRTFTYEVTCHARHTRGASRRGRVYRPRPR